MSADSIVTCPECGEPEFREYYENYFVNNIGVIVHGDDDTRSATGVKFDYGGTCRSCGYSIEFNHTHTFRERKPLAVILKRSTS